MLELIRIYGEFEKAPLSFLKRNLTLVFVTPAVLGGIWQLSILFSIDMLLIRYFSISQIVPDGLLVLLFMLYFLIVGKIIKFFLDFLKFIFVDLRKMSRVLFRNIRLLIYYTSLFIIMTISQDSKISGLVILTSSFLIIFYLFYTLIEYFTDYKPEENVFYKNKNLMFLSCLIFIFLVQGLFNFLPREEFIINGVYNFKELNKKLNTNNLSKNKILYFNDKYIFIRNTNTIKLKNNKLKQTESIKILPMDILMKMDSIK